MAMARCHRLAVVFGSHCGSVSVAAGGNRLRILDIKSDLDLARQRQLTSLDRDQARQASWKFIRNCVYAKGRGTTRRLLYRPDNRVQIYVNDNVLTICISVAVVVVARLAKSPDLSPVS